MRLNSALRPRKRGRREPARLPVTDTSARMTVVDAREEPPESWTKAILAAGPTPRSVGVASWRPQLLADLAADLTSVSQMASETKTPAGDQVVGKVAGVLAQLHDLHRRGDAALV